MKMRNAWERHALPKNYKQVPILVFRKVNVIEGFQDYTFPGSTRLNPAVNIPDSHNTGDFDHFLIDAPHPYAIKREQYETMLTSRHLDVNSVRVGAIVSTCQS